MVNHRLFGIFAVLLSSSPAAFAVENTSVSSTGASLDLAATLGALLLVVGIILGLAWLLKRMKVPGMMNQQGLKIVRQIPVGTKERIAIVQAGEQQFLVGITAHNIQLISELDEPIEANTPNSANAPFASQSFAKQPFAKQLSKLMSQSQNKKDNQA
ncbi:flagellar biosynthetic protein FliO [Vibrio hippocampi]|uniref:Flagellar protein n=1 Tax=Vibrio hippocampi TaxID=654686 RepID=A0ABN8DHN0_9VIBR|nr:flagellar biosynthetic protein FliO [Vibrio hippocampi]CAH0525190.1 hypothetical protein VHP8226_00846 [Vibrio hippocampi]